MIVKWYMKAAEMGEDNPMNEVGSSYTTKFDDLPYDFNEAVKYYVRTIKAGYLKAFEKQELVEMRRIEYITGNPCITIAVG